MSRDYTNSTAYRLGRGVSVHYTPSNVPLNFCYSLVAGLLAGNSCAIRLSEKETVEVDKVIELLEAVLSNPEFAQVRNRIFLFRAPPSDGANDYLAEISDIRVLWGGDRTIDKIRSSPLRPHAFDITFPDRYSVSLVSSEGYLEENNKKAVAAAFYNDTFVFDQNACSSPKAVYWVGPKEMNSRAQGLFWDELHQYMREKGYRCPVSMTSTKLTMVASLAVEKQDPKMKVCELTGNVVVSVEPTALQNPSAFTGGGYFLQADVDRLESLPPMLDRKLQTVTYLGFSKEELEHLLMSSPPKINADRLVKVGNATAFDIVWDGYELISQMSKRIVIQ
jgi:hypothetical protein